MRPTLTVTTLAAGLLLAVAPTPLHAGELWIDYLEQRFPICPPAEDGNAMLDERAGDFLFDTVHDLDKQMAPGEPELSLTRNETGQRSTTFSVKRQSQLREHLDSVDSNLLLLFPPIERNEQPLQPAGLHAPLRAAFWKILHRTPLDNVEMGATLGPLLSEYLAAKARAELLLPGTGVERTKTLESDDMLAALEKMESVYVMLRPALLRLVGREDFSALVETGLWAECLGGSEGNDS